MSFCKIINVQEPDKKHGDHLVIKNISVADSWSYPDCSCKERIKLQFTPCDNDGSINGSDFHSIVDVPDCSKVTGEELIAYLNAKAFKPSFDMLDKKFAELLSNNQFNNMLNNGV